MNAVSAPTEVVVETRTDAPPEIARSSDVPFRSDVIPIRVSSMQENFGALEYKVTMKAGDTLVYSWTASDELRYEFHGHTLASQEQPEIEVMNYRIDQGKASHGTLVAPIDGIHGWFFANGSFDTDVTVELRLSGYYTLEPGIIGIR